MPQLVKRSDENGLITSANYTKTWPFSPRLGLLGAPRAETPPKDVEISGGETLCHLDSSTQQVSVCPLLLTVQETS